MVDIRKATLADIDMVMGSRIEMLKVVNNLSEDVSFEAEFIHNTRSYFENQNQTTLIAIESEVVGCATICYTTLMPTFDHPSGKRAHIMNVYTRNNYRRQGVALRMMNMLIDEAKQNGVTEISLDTTTLGKTLYEKCGFIETEEGMVLNLKNI